MAGELKQVTGISNNVTSPTDDDVQYIVHKNGANYETGKITLTNLKAFLKTYFDGLYFSASKASAADLIAGTDDENYATAKGLKDAGFVAIDLIDDVPHKQFWVGNAKPAVTNGCGNQAQIEMGTNKNVYDYLPFDAAAVEYAYANVAMPQDYTGGDIYAKFYWTHPTATTNFKVSFGLQGVSFANDDTLDAAQGTAQYANDEGGATSDLYVSGLTSAITIAGTPAAGDLVNFRILRNATDGTNDTLAVDAYLIGAMIWYPVA